jgi:hypothetical protein
MSQDAVEVRAAAADGTAVIAAVADGHGGARYLRSRIGSALAVLACADTL